MVLIFKNLGGFINEFSTPDLMEKYKIELPKDFILLGKVLNILEDIGRESGSNFQHNRCYKTLNQKVVSESFESI